MVFESLGEITLVLCLVAIIVIVIIFVVLWLFFKFLVAFFPSIVVALIVYLITGGNLLMTLVAFVISALIFAAMGAQRRKTKY